MKQVNLTDNTWKLITQKHRMENGESVNNFFRRIIVFAQPELVTRKQAMSEYEARKEQRLQRKEEAEKYVIPEKYRGWGEERLIAVYLSGKYNDTVFDEVRTPEVIMDDLVSRRITIDANTVHEAVRSFYDRKQQREAKEKQERAGGI